MSSHLPSEHQGTSMGLVTFSVFAKQHEFVDVYAINDAALEDSVMQGSEESGNL